MIQFYISRTLDLYEKHPEIVEPHLKILLQEPNLEISEASLSTYAKDELMMIYADVKREVAVATSPLSLQEIIDIITQSEQQGDICLNAFTEYECVRCGAMKLWHNSNVPLRCDECTTQAAYNVIHSGILKRIWKRKDEQNAMENKR